MLQSYFDGELSGEMMESATMHLASCSTCAAAAREIEEEINLMMTALAPEFEAGVPTERLRQRIDAAVLDVRVEAASSRQKAGFGAFVSSLLGFGTQRTLGYASLALVLAFAAIFAVVKLRTAPQENIAQTQPIQNTPVQKVIEQAPANVITVRKNTDGVYRPVRVASRSNTSIKTNAPPKTEPVKLLPGERSYLQAIARLDTTINANKKTMRPSLQVEYERNLAVVDRTIAATRTAVKKNPNDPDTADFMFAAYQSKVDLLNTIADARLGGGRSH
jgi:hypothetical protein